MIVPMTKVRILGHKACLDSTLAVLQELALVQVEPAKESLALRAMALDVDRLGQREEARFLLARLDAMLAILPPPDIVQPPPPPAQPPPVDMKALRAELDEVMPQVQALAQQRDALLHEQVSLPRYQATLTRLLPLTSNLPEFRDYETIALLLDRRYREVLDLLDQTLKELSELKYTIVSAPLDSETIGALVVFPRTISAEMHNLLGREQVTQVRLPPDMSGMSLQQALVHIERRLAEVGTEIASVNAGLHALAQQWRAAWAAAAAALRARLAQLEVISQLAETDYAFVLTGWTPAAALPRLEGALAERAGSQVIVEALPLTAAERRAAPIMLENAAVARPFEFFIRLLALPRYGTLDPASLMAFFMPLFFGMMLGDVAYGLALLGLSLWAARRFRGNATLRDLARILALGSGWAVVFGFMYGEFLGTLGHRIGLHPLWLAREDPQAVSSLLLMTIAVGAVHVVLGLLLGVWQAWRSQSQHQLAERGGLLLGLVAVFLLIAAATQRLPRGLMTPAVAALLVGIALLARAEWPTNLLMAPIEILSTIGNVLSYLRLAAIGLASVYLAQVANDMAGMVGSIWLGLIIAALFHALNLVMGAFSPTIHALRLHYVEFFGKFYEEGGAAFSPFGRQ